MKIVIVDDEPKIRKGLVKLLIAAARGWEISGSFEDARSAMTFIQKYPADVLLTDIRMPEQSGLELIYRVKEIDPDIQVIILSGYSNFSYAQRAIEIGVFRYLTKPTKPKELIATLVAIENRINKSQYHPIPSKDFSVKDYQSADNPLVNHALKYIELHYSEKITLESISRDLYITPNYLCELFKKHTGKNITEFISEYRVEKAQYILNDLKYRVVDVAEMVGFKDPQYFSATFKKITGMTPNEYRKKASLSIK